MNRNTENVLLSDAEGRARTLKDKLEPSDSSHWLTQINGSLPKSVQLVETTVHGDVAHKVEGIFVLG